jgi:hypothetical protein
MTYRQLAAEIERLNDEQKDMDVTFFGNDTEYYPIRTLAVAADDDVLHKEHPVLW